MLIDDASIVGKHVMSADGRVLGELVGFEIDVESWRIEWLDVRVLREVTSELGLRKPFFGALTVRIAPGYVRSVKDAVVLRLDLSAVGDAVRQTTEAKASG